MGSSLQPTCVCALYLSETQPDQWDEFSRMHGSATPEYRTDEHERERIATDLTSNVEGSADVSKTTTKAEQALLKSVARKLDKKGTLHVLRNTIKDRGAKFRLCQFKPDHDLNPETMARYAANRLRVVPELSYSLNEYRGRLDLALFVNGIPVATIELKSEFKQSVDRAVWQYKNGRKPKSDKGKPEPLLTFKRGALVHFAVSQFEVQMTTRLAGKSTFFLPFNKGGTDGSKGNIKPGPIINHAFGTILPLVYTLFARFYGAFIPTLLNDTQIEIPGGAGTIPAT